MNGTNTSNFPCGQIAAPFSRRDWLKRAGGGAGMIALANLLAEQEVHGAETDRTSLSPLLPQFPAQAKSVIWLFMEGAPSAVDMFDPKPELTKRHGQKTGIKAFFGNPGPLMKSPFRFRQYGECGQWVCDRYTNVAQHVDKMAFIKSCYSESNDHVPAIYQINSGLPRPGFPTAGAWVTYGLGTENQNLPGYVVLNSGRGSSGGATLWQSGFLPSVYSGVLFRNQGEPVLNLTNPTGLPPELQRKGLDVLRTVNGERYSEIRDPEIASRIASYELAFRMQTAAPELIDVSSESKETIENYGLNRTQEPSGGGRGQSGGTRASFGRNCLLARRLVERGVRFVNIVYASWDHHSNLDNELKYNSTVVDQPMAALIQDLKQRDMLKDTMVVWGGEFGRTPLGENRGGKKQNTGRDHHPYSFSMFLAGGGMKGGMVYGESDEVGWGVAKDPVHINDLHATMLHQFGLDHLKLTHRFQGRDFRLTDVGGKVINDWIA